MSASSEGGDSDRKVVSIRTRGSLVPRPLSEVDQYLMGVESRLFDVEERLAMTQAKRARAVRTNRRTAARHRATAKAAADESASRTARYRRATIFFGFIAVVSLTANVYLLAQSAGLFR